MPTHLAALTLSPNQPLRILPLPTPRPGPNDLLIETRSLALNPADHLTRSTGLLIPPAAYPTATGFDLAGVVLEVGENVPDAHEGPVFQPGTRVAAYAAWVWKGCCGAAYGAFQEKCLVPWQHAAVLPASEDGGGVSWDEAATLPVAFCTALSAWDALGLPRVGGADGVQTGEEKGEREALLVWGASSSVGTAGVQSACVLRRDGGKGVAAVYAVAGEGNLGYVRGLGADRALGYGDEGVVGRVVEAARRDGVVIRRCFLAVGEVGLGQEVLGAFVGGGEGGRGRGRIASAPILPEDMKEMEGVDVVFVQPSMVEEERLAQFRYWMGTWVTDNLANGKIRPSPEPCVVGKGLEAVNTGLDMLIEGISCKKLVVEVMQ